MVATLRTRCSFASDHPMCTGHCKCAPAWDQKFMMTYGPRFLDAVFDSIYRHYTTSSLFADTDGILSKTVPLVWGLFRVSSMWSDSGANAPKTFLRRFLGLLMSVMGSGLISDLSAIIFDYYFPNMPNFGGSSARAWTCMRCRLENGEDFPACDLCGEARAGRKRGSRVG